MPTDIFKAARSPKTGVFGQALFSRTGLGWDAALGETNDEKLHELADLPIGTKFLFLDPDGDTLRLDSALNWKSAPGPKQAYNADERKALAEGLYRKLRTRGHTIKVTDVAFPAAFWAIENHTSSGSTRTYIEMPIWQQYGDNLYVKAEGSDTHISAYQHIFDLLWGKAREWAAKKSNTATQRM